MQGLTGQGFVSILIIGIMATSFGAMGAGLLWFFQNYYLQNPILIQTRCGICAIVTPTPTATPTPEIKIIPSLAPETQGRKEDL
mgnify:CR=1 FL=1